MPGLDTSKGGAEGLSQDPAAEAIAVLREKLGALTPAIEEAIEDARRSGKVEGRLEVATELQRLLDVGPGTAPSVAFYDYLKRVLDTKGNMTDAPIADE